MSQLAFIDLPTNKNAAGMSSGNDYVLGIFFVYLVDLKAVKDFIVPPKKPTVSLYSLTYRQIIFGFRIYYLY